MDANWFMEFKIKAVANTLNVFPRLSARALEHYTIDPNAWFVDERCVAPSHPQLATAHSIVHAAEPFTPCRQKKAWRKLQKHRDHVLAMADAHLRRLVPFDGVHSKHSEQHSETEEVTLGVVDRGRQLL